MLPPTRNGPLLLITCPFGGAMLGHQPRHNPVLRSEASMPLKWTSIRMVNSVARLRGVVLASLLFVAGERGGEVSVTEREKW